MGTSKKASQLSSDNVLRSAHVDETSSLSINGYVSAKVGHKIVLSITTTTVSNDTEVYTYLDGSNMVMELTVIYTDGTRAQLLSVERTA